MTQHVAIVGAGIVGVSTALWLQRAGHRVTLVDRLAPGEGASHGNGGVLASCALVPVPVPGIWRKAPGMLLDPNQPLFLKWRYLPRALPWLVRYLRTATAQAVAARASAIMPIIGDSLADHQALAEGTPAARYVIPSDYIYLYDDRAAFDADAAGWSIRAEHGFRWEVLEGAAVQAADPLFGRHLGCAVRLGNHGRISDPGAYVKALAAHVERQGGRVLRAEVDDVVRDAGQVTGLRAGGETLDCDAVVLAAGAWSARLAAQLGLTVPLESERGYHLELWEPSAMLRAPVMIAGAKFVATPMEGRIRLAGIVEFGGLDAPPSRAPFRLLERSIRRAMPDLTWKRTVPWMGHRPGVVDSLPLIGALPGLTGAYAGFGHDHVGLTGGPKTGRLLAQVISGQSPNISLAPYDPGRFQ